MGTFKPIGTAAADLVKRLDAAVWNPTKGRYEYRIGQFEAVAQRRDERALYHAERVLLDTSDDEYARDAERAQRIDDAQRGFDD